MARENGRFNNFRTTAIAWSAIIGLALLIAVPIRYSVTLNDFTAKRITKRHFASFPINKIHLEIIANTTKPVTLLIGDRDPVVEFELPTSGTITHKSDWYSSSFNVWFENGKDAKGEVKLRYHFPRR